MEKMSAASTPIAKPILKTVIMCLFLISFMFCISVNAASSGSCGTNVTYTLDDDGILTISGSGAMKNYSSYSDSENYTDAPWYSAKSYIKSVIIEDGVTSIGNAAFYQCSNMKSITIADSVTSIGRYAFFACSSLTNISLPNCLISIDNYAFYGCSGLESITIPSSVTSIGNCVFQSCGCFIIVDKENEAYCSIDGVLYDKSLTCLIKYPSVKTETSFIMPATVKRISAYAFQSCSNLTNIDVSDNVTYIGEGAFLWCTSLKSIEIPYGVKTIYANTFYYCSSLESVVISDSVTAVGEWAFSFCTSLKNVEIRSNYLRAETNSFFGCNAVEVVYRRKNGTYGGLSFSSSTTSYDNRRLVEDDSSLYIDNIDTESNTFDIVIDTSVYGGESPAEYLDGVYILADEALLEVEYEDGDGNTIETASDYVKYYTYDDDKAVFKVQYNNSTGNEVAVRAKIAVKSSADDEDTTDYYSVSQLIS
ncbi:MAG: leucine-rich repeat domain-containing protein [Clostridiales bacterium]|nr:leucine-rich repeat domain-containing protein [Clostridiales bacterium]